MTDKPETVEDVLAEMRGPHPIAGSQGARDMDHARRIEAALKRRDDALLKELDWIERKITGADDETCPFGEKVARIRAIVEKG